MSSTAMSLDTRAVRLATLKRRLVPSLSDLFFVAVIVWLFMTAQGGWNRLLSDGDLGYHIRTGDWILLHGRVPATDLYSFSRAGAPWFAWEWLTDVLYALLHSGLGLRGIVVVSGVVIALSATIALKNALRSGANVIVSVLLVLVALNASAIHFHARPHLFTLLFLTTALAILDRDRSQPSRSVWLLAPLTVLWTNMHGGFVAFFVLLGLLVAGTWMERGWRPAVKRYGLLSLLCAAASLINPYGFNLYLHLIPYLRSGWIREFVHEFQSPQFRDEAGYCYLLILILALGLLGELLRKRRYTEVLWILFLGCSSLVSARHVPLFVLAAAPIVARELTGHLSRWSVGRILDDLSRQFAPSFRTTSIWGFAGVAFLLFAETGQVWPTDLNKDFFPVGMVQKHGELLASARVLTSDQWGDYLIYHNYPRQRVLIDGRSDFYGRELVMDYLAAWNGNAGWRKVLDKHRFDAILAPPDQPIVSLVRMSAGWSLVEDDGKAVLLVRDRTPRQ